jgi:hypothetical protein
MSTVEYIMYLIGSVTVGTIVGLIIVTPINRYISRRFK